MAIDIVLPSGERVQYSPRSSVHAGSLARNLARKYGVWKKGTRWRLRGPLGPIDPRQEVRRIDLNVGEAITLEQQPE